MLRARNLTTERQSEVEALGFAAGRIARELETREHDRLTQIARLKREIAQIEGTQAEARAATDRLANEVEQKVVRAPISGTIADLAPLRTGSVIVTGTRIATIVPDGDLKVVAFFRPSDALGRIHPGQKARIRLEGFPWTQYGSPTARVAAVAGEARDGTIRVDLTLDPGQPSEIPLQHGLPAEVSVEIEHISPVALVLRSIGAFTRVAAAGR
jgi:membrane fusion protein (multidrug efflux system)